MIESMLTVKGFLEAAKLSFGGLPKSPSPIGLNHLPLPFSISVDTLGNFDRTFIL